MNTKIKLLCVLVLSTHAIVGQTLKVTLKTYARTEEYGEYLQPYVTLPDLFNRNKIANRAWTFDAQTKRAYEPLGPAGQCFHFALYTSFTNFSAIKTVCAVTNFTAKQQLVMEKLVRLGTKQYIVYAIIDKKKNTKTYYVNEVNPTLDLVGAPVQLCVLNDYRGEGVESMVRISPNGKTILLAKGSTTPHHPNHKALECAVVDENLKLLWQKSFDFSLNGESRLLDEVAVDDAGNAYVLTGIDPTVLSTFRKNLTKPALYAYFWTKNDKLTFSTLGEESQTNFGSKLFVTDSSAFAVGLSKSGYFVYHANMATGMVDKFGAASLTKGDFLTADYTVRNIQKLNCGDIVFTAEEFTTQHFSNGTSTSYAGPMIIASCNGKTNWEHAVYKEQKSYSAENSHILISFQDNIVILYNDNPENAAMTSASSAVKPFNGKKTAINVLKINRSGEVKKELLDIGKTTSNYALVNEYELLVDDLYYIKLIQDGEKYWPATMLIR